MVTPPPYSTDGKGTNQCHLAGHLPRNDVKGYIQAVEHAVDTWRSGSVTV
jgi:hypothetical protein